jgi:predicted ATP-dependent endonuclease of OLD family
MNFVEKVQFQNYRNLEKFELKMNDFSCLIGKNGVGKSNILKGISIFEKSELDKSTKNAKHNFTEEQSITYHLNIQNPQIKPVRRMGLIINFQPGKFVIEKNEKESKLLKSNIRFSYSEETKLVELKYPTPLKLVSITENYIKTHPNIPFLKKMLKNFRNESAIFVFTDYIENFQELIEFEEFHEYLSSRLEYENQGFNLSQRNKSGGSSSSTFTPISPLLFRNFNEFYRLNLLFRFITPQSEILFDENIELTREMIIKIIPISVFIKNRGITYNELRSYNQITQVNFFNEMSKEMTKFIKNYDYIWDKKEIKFDITSTNYLTIKIYHLNGNQLKYDDLSSGEQWLLHFIFNTYDFLTNDSISGIILIDEPGFNLHPGAQISILKILKQLSKKAQILYSTHMPFLIDFENWESLLLLDTDIDGNLYVNYKKVNLLENLNLSLGIPKNHLFLNQNKYLLCEGLSDKKLFQTLIKYMLEKGEKMIFEDLSQIIEVGGAGFSKSLAESCSKLPLKNFIVILDSDKIGKRCYKHFQKKNRQENVILLHKLNSKGGKIENVELEDFIPSKFFSKGLKEYFKSNKQTKEVNLIIKELDKSPIENYHSRVIKSLEKSVLVFSKIDFMNEICSMINSDNYNQFGSLISILKQASEKLKEIINQT